MNRLYMWKHGTSIGDVPKNEKHTHKNIQMKGMYIGVKGEKVKLSLCLTKHHAMKMYWGSGGIAPRILDLGTRWK